MAESWSTFPLTISNRPRCGNKAYIAPKSVKTTRLLSMDLSPLSSGILIDLIIRDVTSGCQLNGHFVAKYMVVNEDVADFRTSFAS